MNNRRHTGSQSSDQYNQNPRHKTDGDRSFGERPSRSPDSRNSPRDDRRPSSGRTSDSQYRTRGAKFDSKSKFPPKGDKRKPWEKEKVIRIVSEMQVTDGKHKGKYLTSSESSKVRPTSRRIREVMFRILYRRVKAGRVLDLCAGAGTIGIEAISRGALIATFVERSAKMCSFIKKNLESLEIKIGHGEVFEIEVIPFLKQMAKRKREWDVVYFDPPYDADYEEVLEMISRGVIVKPRGVLVIEHPAEMFFPEKIGVLNRWRVVVQGDIALSFFDRKQ